MSDVSDTTSTTSRHARAHWQHRQRKPHTAHWQHQQRKPHSHTTRRHAVTTQRTKFPPLLLLSPRAAVAAAPNCPTPPPSPHVVRGSPFAALHARHHLVPPLTRPPHARNATAHPHARASQIGRHPMPAATERGPRAGEALLGAPPPSLAVWSDGSLYFFVGARYVSSS